MILKFSMVTICFVSTLFKSLFKIVLLTNYQGHVKKIHTFLSPHIYIYIYMTNGREFKTPLSCIEKHFARRFKLQINNSCSEVEQDYPCISNTSRLNFKKFREDDSVFHFFLLLHFFFFNHPCQFIFSIINSILSLCT